MTTQTIAAATFAAQNLAATAEQAAQDAPTDAIALANYETALRSLQPLTFAAGGTVFLLPTENVATLADKIAKLNKRAVKIGCTPATITTHEEIMIPVGRKFSARTYVAVKGDAPKINGWSFVATLEHDENGVIVRKLPTYAGACNLAPFRTADPSNCDHCKLNRRRNDTYVVEHDTGATKQVGSTCLADFLGHVAPEKLASWLTSLADILDDCREGGAYHTGTANRYGVTDFLSHAACMIGEHGWTSKGVAYQTGKTATAQHAENNLRNFENNVKGKNGLPLFTVPSIENEATAIAAIEWVRALTDKDLENDYLYNLFTACKGESIPARQFGIAASAISAHAKAQERSIKFAAMQARAQTSEHVGTVGGKHTERVTVLRIAQVTDYYNGGTKPLYIFATPEGNEVKWFASKDQGWNVGDALTICGKVKAHDTHDKYGKSTTMTHVKAV